MKNDLMSQVEAEVEVTKTGLLVRTSWEVKKKERQVKKFKKLEAGQGFYGKDTMMARYNILTVNDNLNFQVLRAMGKKNRQP